MSDINVSEPDQGKEAGDVAPKAIPFESYQAEKDKRQRLEVELAELKGRDAVRNEASKPKQHTRAELQTHVDDGRLGQDEADRILNEQTENTIVEKATKRIEASNQQDAKNTRISEEISKFTAAKPNIKVDGSDERNMVETEYQHLLGMGKPEGAETELDALRTVFGSSSKLQAGREKELQTHEDVGGDGGESSVVEGKAPKGLSAEAKRYYGKQIENGMYKDWDAVTKELEHASPGPKRRMGVG